MAALDVTPPPPGPDPSRDTGGTPTHTPRRPLLIYDGDCGFCTTSAKAIRRRWSGGAAIAAYQQLGEDGLSRLGLRSEQAEAAAWWIDERGRRFRGHRAVAKALQAAGGFLAPVGTALLVPPVSVLARAGYWLVSRFRHRLPGGTPACKTG